MMYLAAPRLSMPLERSALLTVYFDQKKAFNLVSHNELLGVTGPSFWFKAYLFDRQHIKVLSRGPQSNVLGPLLYLIYIIY